MDEHTIANEQPEEPEEICLIFRTGDHNVIDEKMINPTDGEFFIDGDITWVDDKLAYYLLQLPQYKGKQEWQYCMADEDPQGNRWHIFRVLSNLDAATIALIEWVSTLKDPSTGDHLDPVQREAMRIFVKALTMAVAKPSVCVNVHITKLEDEYNSIQVEVSETETPMMTISKPSKPGKKRPNKCRPKQ